MRDGTVEPAGIQLRVGGQLRWQRLPAGTSKTDAIKELRRLKGKRDVRETPIARSIRMDALAEFAFAALDSRAAVGKGSRRTATEYRRRWRLHLAPRIGRRKLNDVTKQTVLGLRDELREESGLAETSIGSVLVVLRSVLAYAREADFTTGDPFRGIRRGELPLPSASDKVKRVLRRDEVWRLIDSTHQPYTAIVTLLAWSGLRVSEAAQNISERGIEEAGVRAGLECGVRAQMLRHSFCTFVAESGVPPNEGAALTGHDEMTWWRDYVQPRRDAQSRRDNIAALAANGIGIRAEVDQRLTNC